MSYSGFSTTPVNQLIRRKGNPLNHKGRTFVTPLHVCKNEGGYYVGTWCIQELNGSWLANPHKRLTAYMTRTECFKYLGK